MRQQLIQIDGDSLFVELPHPRPHHLLGSQLLRVAHDLGRPSQNLLHPAHALVLSGLAGVQPQVGKALGQTIARTCVQQELDALPILDFRAMAP
jgi:hypothetical protein